MYKRNQHSVVSSMRPPNWNPPVELSVAETHVVKRIRKAKLFAFLRAIRHQLFNDEFQAELGILFKDSSVGKCPVPPAQLALAIILQAYTGVSDDEVIEALVMDRRWQLVLDCLDCEQAPFGKGTLIRFRAALIAKEGDRRLIEKTITKVNKSLAAARQIEAQDVEEVSDESPKLSKGVAKNRRITIEDEQMRHGRKSRSQRFDGYKRHVLKDLDLGLVRAVGLTPANEPEASVTTAIEVDLQHQQVTLKELLIDRAYLTSKWVKERASDLTIICKAWRVRNGNMFDKTAFVLDWEHHLIRCPNGVSIPFSQGQVVHFSQTDCQLCPLRSQCTTSATGRSISIHPDEFLLQELRQRQTTVTGRAKLRERVSVEHSLARIGQWQGDKARYFGIRKNLFDLRRMAVVHNLHVLQGLSENTATEAA